jgi:hypothetical protein
MGLKEKRLTEEILANINQCRTSIYFQINPVFSLGGIIFVDKPFPSLRMKV